MYIPHKHYIQPWKAKKKNDHLYATFLRYQGANIEKKKMFKKKCITNYISYHTNNIL